MITKVISVSIVLMFMILDKSHAESPKPIWSHYHYELIEGNGYDVCEAYLKHLNSFPPENPPMVCERAINQELKDFSKPNTWEELDMQQNLELVRQMDAHTFQNDKSAIQALASEMMFEKLKQKIDQGCVALARAKLDFDNDGAEEIIFLYKVNLCSPTKCSPGKESDFALPIGSRYFFILNSQTSQIDFKKSKIIYGTQMDILEYKQRYYFADWQGKKNFQEGYLRIYKSTPSYLIPYCRYKYSLLKK